MNTTPTSGSREVIIKAIPNLSTTGLTLHYEGCELDRLIQLDLQATKLNGEDLHIRDNLFSMYEINTVDTLQFQDESAISMNAAALMDFFEPADGSAIDNLLKMFKHGSDPSVKKFKYQCELCFRGYLSRTFMIRAQSKPAFFGAPLDGQTGRFQRLYFSLDRTALAKILIPNIAVPVEDYAFVPEQELMETSVPHTLNDEGRNFLKECGYEWSEDEVPTQDPERYADKLKRGEQVEQQDEVDPYAEADRKTERYLALDDEEGEDDA